jgi:hypothetical protein
MYPTSDTDLTVLVVSVTTDAATLFEIDSRGDLKL